MSKKHNKPSLADKSHRHDVFHQRAKKEGFRSRAIFKLEEIDKRFSLIARDTRVLDLGCAPGSWLQYVRTKTGPRGVIVGIDRFEIDPPIPKTRLIVGDLNDVSADELRGELEGFDVVLSDMAPDTIGVRHVDQTRCEQLFELALDVAEQVLTADGNFVGKLFQGPEFPALLKRCRGDFRRVKVVKPTSSRRQSIEQYVVCLGYKGGRPQEPREPH